MKENVRKDRREGNTRKKMQAATWRP